MFCFFKTNQLVRYPMPSLTAEPMRSFPNVIFWGGWGGVSLASKLLEKSFCMVE